MKNTKLVVCMLACSLSLHAFGQKKSKKDDLITIETEQGTMHAILFDETPRHKENFIKLTKDKLWLYMICSG